MDLITTYALMIVVAIAPLIGLGLLIWIAAEDDKDREKNGARPRYPQ